MLKQLFNEISMTNDQTVALPIYTEDANIVSIEVMWEDVTTGGSAPDGVLNVYSSHGLGKCLEKSIDITSASNINDTIIVDITGPARMIYLEYLHNAINGGKLSATAVLRRI
jgi:hypothetical protein